MRNLFRIEFVSEFVNMVAPDLEGQPRMQPIQFRSDPGYRFRIHFKILEPLFVLEGENDEGRECWDLHKDVRNALIRHGCAGVKVELPRIVEVIVPRIAKRDEAKTNLISAINKAIETIKDQLPADEQFDFDSSMLELEDGKENGEQNGSLN